MLNQLLVARWISSSFPVIRTILLVCLAIVALVLILLVFLQIGQGSNTNNSITGSTDNYYSQNKGSSREGRITRWIYICLGIIAVLCVVYFITLKIYKG
ncbi:MAG: preprotein translocase subunit SecG [Clostridia bacterium]|nr:preprotein translocase subunit SecG [Clostridia bacterium]